MAWLPDYSSSRPLFYWGERPVTATLFLVGLHVIGLLFTSVAFALQHSEWTIPLMFSNREVLANKTIWQWVTYAFLNTPGFLFLFDMLILYFFGKPLEETMGVKRFMAFYIALVVTTPILFTFVAPWFPVRLEGTLSVHFGLVVAVALLFPDSETFLFRIPLKVMMWILLALYTLQFLAFQRVTDLCNLWLTSAIAWGSVGFFQESQFSWFSDIKAKLYSKRHQIKLMKSPEKGSGTAMSLDLILEKISKQGMKSLSAAEKEFLERERQTLLKNDKK